MAALSQEDETLLRRIGAEAVAAREKKARRRNFRSAFGFMAPALLLVSGLLLYPVAFNIYLSFTDWRKFTGLDTFVGFRNYERLFETIYFTQAAFNTMIWVVASLIFPVLLGLGLAILLRGIRFENTFKSLIFLPRVMAPTAVGVIWYYVYAPTGLLNYLLSLITGRTVAIGWLYQDNTVTASIIATHVWQTVGIIMVLLLLGLAAIPRDPVEAAQMDGAKPWQTYVHVILPMLMPTLVVVTIISVLAGFTAFDLLWVMGAGYPGQRTLSLVVYMYFEAFQKGGWAFGGAVAVVIGILVLLVTWFQAALQARAEKMVR
ncbi:sugar ABC transporter permease [Mesorhizobium sp. NZP2077]|uniref:carbohydrate ABC transporter permease n=1 Tax=Mesorhizobium sp. NZP2077 TaxID=2483404 RepID=UPI001551BB07|nr:sugar ABC transporter permease [Mesorhizobium sp. NZP2077]QKC85381.1 sugar ABC transporter permease [Mesorhizobium sp. NZP2077]QKD19020.1 sugar ABC transporter permease [Mesorhizobium sp. NZP2077]